MIEKSNISEVRKNINTYPNIFVVKMDDTQRNVTYSYTDVLTHSVELGVGLDGAYNSILNTVNPEVKI